MVTIKDVAKDAAIPSARFPAPFSGKGYLKRRDKAEKYWKQLRNWDTGPTPWLST